MKNTLQIRPEARLINSIGAELIKDYYAALIELVKNAYDADAENVKIILSYEKARIYEKEEDFLKFTIQDDGEGMSLDTIDKAWMVPATSYKLSKKVSTDKIRPLQGRKGIGRYACAILGNYLRIETTTKEGETTLIEIDWNEFITTQEHMKYLDEIEIPYEHEKTNLPKGTKIEIYSKIIQNDDDTYSINWLERDYKKLLKELRNLIVPIEKEKKDKFNIFLEYKRLSSFGFDDKSILIEPFPLLELYDYRVSGVVVNGKGKLCYENQNYTDSNEHIEISVSLDASYGRIEVDLRFFDLDPQGIEDLINRGLKDPTTNEYLGKREAQKLIQEYAGIGIYRNLFGIRPYSDANYDWLALNKRRIFNPTIRVSTNQVIGFINIEAEETSHLIEQSNREGLKETSSYESLKITILEIIKEVEARRYIFRQNTKRGRKPASDIKESIRNLFNFDHVSNKIRYLLEGKGIENSTIIKVEETLKNAEKDKEKDYKKIQDTLVMYEAHAALGRLVQLVIHEGRKPLQFIGSNLDNLKMDIEYFINNSSDLNTQNSLLEFVDTNKKHLQTISKLFASLDPLTAKRLAMKKNFNLYRNIINNFSFFQTQFELNKIKVEIQCNENINFFGREEDFFIIFTNLIENSIYWLKKATRNNQKIINLSVSEEEKNIILDFKDSGEGIKEQFASEIFDAGFSMKPEGGTGIGLTLVGQAISRNDGKIECIKNDNGAHFRITLKKVNHDGN